MGNDLRTWLGDDLPPEVVAALERQRTSASALATLVGYESVVLEGEDDLELPVPEVSEFGDRFIDLGPIGAGGMGEVRRVRDRELNRNVAMKIAHPDLLRHPSAVARFIEEAQASAQLQHPNLVPVHDMGRLPDGRLWFTMREVRGRTFTEVIDEVHRASSTQWETAESGWSFRRLVSAFQAVCNAMAYAHERGVIHRDLKPDNIMVGERGEVYVLDWGLAKVVGRPDRAAEAGELEIVSTDRSEGSEHRTRMGQVAGTPAYMPPEQARGQVDQIDARSDVYALGAILYEVLSGRPPYEGHSQAVLAQVLAGPPAPVGRAVQRTFGFDLSLSAEVAPPTPEELASLCERAMERESSRRLASAVAFAEAVQSWLDGAHRREQALAIVERALEKQSQWGRLHDESERLKGQAADLLRDVPPAAAEERKAPGWALEDEAQRLQEEIASGEMEVERAFHSALQVEPTLVEAHTALVELYQRKHREAEQEKSNEAKRYASMLAAHLPFLPGSSSVGQRAATYLRGDGGLTLETDPSGAEVLLYRYVEKNRRLVEVFERSLGTTPLRSVPLAMGSYLCIVKKEGFEPVRYPVFIERGTHWDGIPPEQKESLPIWLPPAGALFPDEVYVPAGWFWAGGDPEAILPHPGFRRWENGFAIQRSPVTNGSYLEYLNALLDAGEADRAAAAVPRDHEGGSTFTLVDRYQFVGSATEAPVNWVTMEIAEAYLRWRSLKSMCTARFPTDFEWEKAARGVDGRFFPWGSFLDFSRCNIRSRELGPVPCDRYPIDVSPYGVKSVAGNVKNWVVADERAGEVGVRGAAWMGGPRNARAASRLGPLDSSNRFEQSGRAALRIARSVP